MNQVTFISKKLVLPLALFAVTCVAAFAEPVTFTWDLSKAMPAISSPGSTITADTIDVRTYLSSVIQANGTANFQQILQVTGFERNGQPVVVSGLNSAYGLYFNISGVTQMSGGPPAYSKLDISLVADPGNNDGTLSATIPAGLAFSNGMAGDFTLGSGGLVSASLGLDSSGVRRAHYVETFASASGQAAFFGNVPYLLDINLTTPGPNYAAIAQPDGTTINLVNGGLGQVTLAPVPEPTSLALLGGGLFVIVLLTRRSAFTIR